MHNIGSPYTANNFNKNGANNNNNRVNNNGGNNTTGSSYFIVSETNNVTNHNNNNNSQNTRSKNNSSYFIHNNSSDTNHTDRSSDTNHTDRNTNNHPTNYGSFNVNPNRDGTPPPTYPVESTGESNGTQTSSLCHNNLGIFASKLLDCILLSGISGFGFWILYGAILNNYKTND